MKIEEILVQDRYRQDLGNLDKLAQSILEVGLLHPVVVTPAGRLIAGQRRLEACKKLGWDEIPVTVVDLDEIILGEQAENIQRKALTPSEKVAIAQVLRPEKEKLAKERKKRKPKTCSGKFPEQSLGQARDQVAAGLDISGKSLEKAEAVVEAAQKDPEKYGDLQAKMDETGKVDAAFRELQRREKVAAQLAQATELKSLPDYGIDLRTGSMAELFASGIQPDCVITDPPYGQEYLDLYEELARLSVQVPLVAVMTGQTHLPEIIQRMTKHLTYRWTLCYLTPGGTLQQFAPKILCMWKPVLLFGLGDWTQDVFKSQVQDKDFHEWGQSISGMMDLVSHLTKPGELVCDPFLGAGTTAVACMRLARRCVGSDIDPAALEKAQQRCQLERANEEKFDG